MAKFRIFIVNLCRMALALTFILSGYVKAIDPLGTQYKLNDYAAAMHLSEYIPDWLTLTGAIALAMTEFALGIFMLFAIRRHLVSRLMTAMMVMIVLRRPLMVFSKTKNISLKRADWALPLMKAARRMRYCKGTLG